MKTIIIAEAGVNHNGDINIAKKLIDEAKKAGADIVKFQTFNPACLASERASMAEYQKRNLGKTESQLNMLKKLALSYDSFIELSEYCGSNGIKFLSTPFDINSIRFLNGIQDSWKIPSGEITNYPYLVEIAKTKKSVILSSGMSTLDEVSHAIDVLNKFGCNDISLLHCNTQYPTPFEDVNLKAMLTMKEYFNLIVGYSDHTLGIEVPIAAVALGAKIIEKHFTLDRKMEGPDHKASLEPHELSEMVNSIRNIEKALGSGEKIPSLSEKKNMVIARKSIVASRNIEKGEMFTEENITTKRPGNGISPMKWNEVIGTRATRNFMEDELIEL